MTTLLVHSRDANKDGTYSALAELRYGLSVTDLEGNVLIAHRADERFMPASNVKLFVTAVALALEAELAALDTGLQVALEPSQLGAPNLVLVGRGDPTIGFGPDCNKRCLETLVEAVADYGITEVGNIIGDDQWFADERKPLGWSWDDLKFGHGTAISAIAVNDNVIPLRVSPSDKAGTKVRPSWINDGPAYYDLRNEAMTSEVDEARALRLERRIGDKTARLYGALPGGSRSLKLQLGVDDPAHLTAWYFKRALEDKGVTVLGEVLTRHRPLQFVDEPISVDPDDPASPLQCVKTVESASRKTVIASLEPAPLRKVVTKINRDSQNLYAEMLLRQLGQTKGNGSSFCGRLQIENFLKAVGVARSSFDITDGSGLSNYNRATPATITALLSYAATALWGDAFRASLPVGGASEGTLRYRFRGTALEGKIFAKTGTLNHADALSGYMQARSGEILVFSIIVNDRPLESPSAMPLIENTLLRIAERY
ncbi:MAG: D-alanyl-D-alanine carboxypeptidase/D-alanyl-D-alanine-endopeptidase [Pseudomonadota bacterium]